MERKGNRMIFSIMDQQLASVPPEAPTCEAKRLREKLAAQAAQVQYLERQSQIDKTRGDLRRQIDLGSRLVELCKLDSELAEAQAYENPVNRELNTMLAEG